MESSTEFLFERTAWPVVHILVPFQFYLIVQNSKATILLFCLWETFENFWPIVCGGTYCILDAKETAESVFNSVEGDVWQGFIGLLLGKLFVVSIGAAQWNMGMRKSVLKNHCCLWFKRIVQFSVIPLAYLFVGVVIRCGEPFPNVRLRTRDEEKLLCDILIGPMLSVICNIAIVLFYALWVNKTKKEIKLFWTKKTTRGKKKIMHRAYWRFHISWIIAILVIGSSSFYDTGLSTMFHSWFHSAVLMMILCSIAVVKGKHHQVIDIFTCGVYSLCTKNPEYYHKNFFPDKEFFVPQRLVNEYK